MDESEILEPIHNCLRELIERDKRGITHSMKYTDHDIVAITLLYTLIMGNRLIHTMTEERVSIGMSKEIAENFAAQIRLTTLSMSRVDTSEYYKDTKK